MTYNVFVGTLNLAQQQQKLMCTPLCCAKDKDEVQKRVTVFCNLPLSTF